MTPLNRDQCLQQYTYETFPLENSPLKWPGLDGQVARQLVSAGKSGYLTSTQFYLIKGIFRGTPIESAFDRYTGSLKAYEVFMEKMKDLQPPPFDHLIHKNQVSALTPVHYFTIHDGVIWSKARYQEDSQWQPIYFDGDLEGRKPISLQADGCNLTVEDDRGYFHYKKAVREIRNGDQYEFIDKATKDNWKPYWYSLPVVSSIFNLFTPKRLYISKDIKSYSLSHAGRYVRYYKDGAGVNHDISTITTIYALFVNSHEIHISDPWWSGGFNHPKTWMGLGFDHTIPMPEDVDFEAQHIDSAGSWILLTGLSKRKTVYYTAMADVDTLGRNSLNKYTRDPSNAKPNQVRMVTPVAWFRQPELPAGYREIDNAAIYQCGEGNENRILQIPVMNLQNEKGLLRKKVNDQAWHFDLLHSIPKI
jgi:hypothetical protein